MIHYCSKCGGIIVKDDTYDTERWEYGITELHVGHCIKCNTDYQWESHYKYAGDSDLEES